MIEAFDDYSAPLLAAQELLREQYQKLLHGDINGAAEMSPQVMTEVKLLQNAIRLAQERQR
jgi:hypothetical protein